MKFLSRVVNLKGELFSSTFTFGLTAATKLVSSLVLTRLLDPAAYGVFGILLSFLFMIELMSDVGTVGLLVRHPRGGEVRFVHTIWTVRLLRSIVNFCVVFFGAPLIARIYSTPLLTGAFRAISLWYLILGAESLSFALAQRDQRARISNYAELIANFIMSVFVIGLAIVLKSYYALIFGSLLQRALLTVGSHFFYRQIGVGIAFDREALRDQFNFARLVMPSSVLTIVLSQYDKVVMLKMFNLSILGIYSIAGNMLAPITGVVMHNARVILYARCAQYFRTDSGTARERYYDLNHRLFLIGILLPALVAGFSQSIVAVLYDVRYMMAGTVLMVLGLGGIAFAFQNASESLLVASGRTETVLIGNTVRLCSLVPATILGYYLFGFYGFIWFAFLATIPPTAYYFHMQSKLGLLDMRNELRRLALAALVFLLALGLSHSFLALVPPGWLHFSLKRH